MFEDFLPLVEKPGRYINSEINAVHKDLSRVKTRICLFFPDTYEVGMSHLGLRILYHILNGRDDTACERVFSPWTDYEDRLRASGRPLSSLESNLPLSQFDIIGITLQYELSYSNILTGLELAKIPVRARDRADVHPVVIAGGPCAVNPEPLSGFIDAFFIGEAEETLHEIVELRQAHAGRTDFLEALSRRDGFYVPAFEKKIVRRRVVKDLESAPYPGRPLLPLMKPIHDRATVEVARGCIRGCRFCQAGIIYRPYRERSPERVKNLLHESLRCTGYDELSLASLSSGDYSAIEPLMQDLVERYRDDRISISLPSLRIGTLTPEMVRAVAGVRKTGFTLAPEAGTERLRRVINKPVSDTDLLTAAASIFASGWNVLKLYFMIGLPTESDEDLDGIIRLAQEIHSVGKKHSKRHVQINITVSTFVPKPHTPFQWFGQASNEDIRAKQDYLKTRLRRRGISLKLHDPATSLLEGALARGDRRIGNVIEKAVSLGCRFDGWSECFDFIKWGKAFAACGLTPAEFACHSYHPGDALPWDHIHTGVTARFLQQEYERAQAAAITENCRTVCEHCGMGCEEGGTAGLGKPASPGKAQKPGPDLTNRAVRQESRPTARVRMKFSKTGRLRFLSHLDLITLFQRAVARADIPVVFSQGFNPHPKIAFSPALSVGMESESEFVDLETDSSMDLLKITKDLNKTLPECVRILEAGVVPKQAPSLSSSISRYAYGIRVPEQYRDGITERVRNFLSQTSIIVSKEGKQKDIRPGIESITVRSQGDPASFDIVLVDQDQLKPRVQDVIAELFGLGQEQTPLLRIRRSGLFYKDGENWKSPMDVA